MQIEDLIPELKQMLKHFLIFVVISPILAYGLMKFIEYFKKYWYSGSKLKKWYILTVTVLTLCIVIIGL